MPGSLLVRVVYALLLVATLAAFFVNQRLKRADPVVERVFFHRWISPNGDGRKDTVALRFDLPDPARVRVAIVDDAGDEIRRLVIARRLGRGTHRLRWNGRTEDGRVAPDGVYRVRVALLSEGRALTAPRDLQLDTEPPRARLVSATPDAIVPGRPGRRGRVRIRFDGPSDPAPLVRVWRTRGERVVDVHRFHAPRFRQTAEWRGFTRRGRAADGTYAFSVTVRDEAGNEATAPGRRPSRITARPGTGIEITRLTASPALMPVRPRGVLRVTLGPVPPKRHRWRLTRLGSRRTLARGTGAGGSAALRIPRKARTGLYVLRVSAGRDSARVPVVVQGPRRAPVLVVLPAITWQGLNEVDEDHDGFADTLDDSPSVGLGRPFAGGRLPPAAIRESGPLLRFLDRERLRYDLTTDLALARSQSVGPNRAVVLAGSSRWLPGSAGTRLVRHARGGGSVASFGVDSLRRTVEVAGSRLVRPSSAAAANVLGERSAVERGPARPLAVERDSLRLFAATDGLFGPFVVRDSGRGLVRGGLRASAADEHGPVVVGYRLDRGLVLRFGTGDWTRRLEKGSDESTITRRAWALLSR